MKQFAPLMLTCAGLLLTGCIHQKTTHATAVNQPPPTIVTPDNSLAGKVVSYNAVGRFVVLNFPSGQLPNVDHRLFLYRAGLKVAEIVITGPASENNTVGDVVSGDAQIGDEVREQ